MKKTKIIRNVELQAENNKNKPGIKIYIVFSGQKEFLMYYRHNAAIYKLLNDGKHIDELKRHKPYKLNGGKHGSRYDKKQSDSISHIIKVAESYIKNEVA